MIGRFNPILDSHLGVTEFKISGKLVGGSPTNSETYIYANVGSTDEVTNVSAMMEEILHSRFTAEMNEIKALRQVAHENVKIAQQKLRDLKKEYFKVISEEHPEVFL